MSYLPSLKRVECPPSMQLTERDTAIISAVHEHRFLNTHQIEALFFPPDSDKGRSRKQACQRRLQRLFHHGFLARLPVPVLMGEGRVPFVYALDEAGATVIANTNGIDRPAVHWKPADNNVKTLFLEHTQHVNNLRVMVERLAQCGNFELIVWQDESALKASDMKDQVPYRMQGARITRIIPDGYFSLRLPGTQKPAHFFLEVDMGTMSNSRWGEKIRAYLQFRRSGRSEKFFGTRNFRVLTVTSTARRLENLKETTEKAEGDRYFWFAPQDAFSIWEPSGLLNPIWELAGEEKTAALFG